MSTFEPQIIAYCCANCASSAAQISEKMGLSLPENVKVIQLPCTGRLDSLHLLKALEAGADGVYVAGCQQDSCQFKHGIEKAQKKVKYVQGLLPALGVEADRVALFHMMAGKGQEFVDAAKAMVEKVRALGPSPLKG
jgi:coenzyme F420-reducing hydrogenase delta subunit